MVSLKLATALYFFTNAYCVHCRVQDNIWHIILNSVGGTYCGFHATLIWYI